MGYFKKKLKGRRDTHSSPPLKAPLHDIASSVAKGSYVQVVHWRVTLFENARKYISFRSKKD